MKIKSIFFNALFIVLNSGFNIAVFLVSYKYLTFPYLYEEQRMDNAPLIFIYVVPAFFLVSFFMFSFLMYRNRAR